MFWGKTLLKGGRPRMMGYTKPWKGCIGGNANVLSVAARIAGVGICGDAGRRTTPTNTTHTSPHAIAPNPLLYTQTDPARLLCHHAKPPIGEKKLKGKDHKITVCILVGCTIRLHHCKREGMSRQQGRICKGWRMRRRGVILMRKRNVCSAPRWSFIERVGGFRFTPASSRRSQRTKEFSRF